MTAVGLRLDQEVAAATAGGEGAAATDGRAASGSGNRWMRLMGMEQRQQMDGRQVQLVVEILGLAVCIFPVLLRLGNSDEIEKRRKKEKKEKMGG